MAFHVVVLSRREVNAGGLRFPETLSESMLEGMIELAQHVDSRRAAGQQIHQELVEILALNPFVAGFHETRARYGQDAFCVLFLNDAARQACEMYGIRVNYMASIEDNQLPENLGVSLRMEHYYAE